MTLQQQLKHWDALIFNENSIELLRTFSEWPRALFNFFLGIFILSLPLTYDEIFTTPAFYVKCIIFYAVMILLLFILSRAFGSDMPLMKFWYTISTIVLFSSIPIMIITYLCLFLLEYVLNNSVVSNLVVSVLPYYLYLLMAFASEQAARIPSQKKSILFGIASVVVIYTVFYFL